MDLRIWPKQVQFSLYLFLEPCEQCDQIGQLSCQTACKTDKYISYLVLQVRIGLGRQQDSGRTGVPVTRGSVKRCITVLERRNMEELMTRYNCNLCLYMKASYKHIFVFFLVGIKPTLIEL